MIMHRFVLHVLSSTLTSGNCLNLLNKSSSMLCSNEIALIFVSSFLVEARTSLSFFFDMTISSLLYTPYELVSRISEFDIPHLLLVFLFDFYSGDGTACYFYFLLIMQVVDNLPVHLANERL